MATQMAGMSLQHQNIKVLHPTFNTDFSLTLKGQMNQKIALFFGALPSLNTKKDHPKWDLGKEFSSQAFIWR